VFYTFQDFQGLNYTLPSVPDKVLEFQSSLYIMGNNIRTCIHYCFHGPDISLKSGIRASMDIFLFKY